MIIDLKGKVVIVTGAAKGIGKVIAERFALEGALLSLWDIDLKELAQTAVEISKLTNEQPIYLECDVKSEFSITQAVEKTVQKFGKIDVLINNAGQGYDASVENTDVKILRQIFELDFVGPLVAMQEVIPIMRGQGGGVIVNISSGTALMALPNMSAYSSIKRALVGLSLTAAQELKKDNIVVSVL